MDNSINHSINQNSNDEFDFYSDSDHSESHNELEQVLKLSQATYLDELQYNRSEEHTSELQSH